jgi:acyl carrier protein
MMGEQQMEKSLDSGEILTNLVEILGDITQDWDTELSGKIGADTSLMTDLTFESIDVVMLIVAIEERFGKTGLPFDELLMIDGRYVDDLRVSELVSFLETHLKSGGVE